MRDSWGFFAGGLEGDALEAAAGASGAHMDGSFEKMLQRLLDDRFPLRMLPPYSAVPEAGFQAFRTWLEHTYPHWTPDAG